MGAHSSAESLMAGVESDSLRVKAAALAVQMQWWMIADYDANTSPFTVECLAVNGQHHVLSDLVEWCRSARDVLEAVGRG